jgi:hypothetical protein
MILLRIFLTNQANCNEPQMNTNLEMFLMTRDRFARQELVDTLADIVWTYIRVNLCSSVANLT